MEEFDKEKARKEFEKIAKNLSKEDIVELLSKKEEVESKIGGPLKKFVKEIELFFSLLKDFISGEYKEVPWFTITAIAAALIYLLSPIDLIPDFIPIIGLSDDAFVFYICLTLVEEDLEKYKRWKEERAKKSSS